MAAEDRNSIRRAFFQLKKDGSKNLYLRAFQEHLWDSGRKETDSCSFSGVDGPRHKNRECDDWEHASSEISTLQSTSLNHDSYSKNAESKGTFRDSVTYDASEDVDMPLKVSSGEAVGENQLLLEQANGVIARNPILAHSVTTSNNADLKDWEGNTQEPSECFVDHVESSLARKVAACNVDGWKSTAFPNYEDRSPGHIRSENNINPYLETKISKGTDIPSDEAMKCNIMKEQFEKPSSLSKESILQGSQNQPDATESENSADIEDVKVCDICGDAGQEELLAICSRCSDGAEHTYCMQKKLDKLPEGDWLCEECKFKEETEYQNLDILETVPGALEVPCLNGNNQNTRSAFDPKLMPKSDTKAMDSEAEGASEKLQIPQISAKRHEDNVEVNLMTSKKVSECGVSVGTASPRKKSLLSGENSFSNLDTGKPKSSKIAASCGGQSVNNDESFARSQSSSGPNSSNILEQLQSPWGPLSKSVSFNNSNMKPKVIQSIGGVPYKQKRSREFASNGTRIEGLVKKMTESASFKRVGSGCSNAESISKTHSLNPPWAEDHRDLKQVKERNMVEKKSSILERPLVNPAPVAAIGNSHPKGDPEVAHISESNIFDINRRSDDTDNSGCNEEKKSSYILKSFGRSSSNLTGQNPCQVVPKEDVHTSSSAADRSSSIPNTILQRSAPQIVEFTHLNDKIKDPTFLSSSKQAASGSSRILRCEKCNETGHPTHLCSIDKLGISALERPAELNQREGYSKSSKWKDAVDAMVSKTRIQKNIRLRDHSVELSSIADLSFEVASKDFQSGSSSCLRNLPRLEGTTDGQEILRSSVVYPSKTATVIDVNLQALQVEASCIPRASDLNPIVTISDELNVKPFPQVLPSRASELANIIRASVIPELKFIWQGSFEVLRSERLPKLCDGVQAHLSTFASSKVLEAAMKFPCKVQLKEVTCLSSWPLQFQGHSPGEHNIALFFFAKDLESYEKNYQKLLENMIKNDLALKGNIDGFELLIFPSNKLPENSQRWNRLFFLWGIFSRRSNCLQALPQFQEKPCQSSLNSEPLVQDLPTPMSEVPMSRKVNSYENPDEDISMSDG